MVCDAVCEGVCSCDAVCEAVVVCEGIYVRSTVFKGGLGACVTYVLWWCVPVDEVKC